MSFYLYILLGPSRQTGQLQKPEDKVYALLVLMQTNTKRRRRKYFEIATESTSGDLQRFGSLEICMNREQQIGTRSQVPGSITIQIQNLILAFPRTKQKLFIILE